MVKSGLLDEVHRAFWALSRPSFASISKWRPDQKRVMLLQTRFTEVMAHPDLIRE
jgi:hypothetical protein